MTFALQVPLSQTSDFTLPLAGGSDAVAAGEGLSPMCATRTPLVPRESRQTETALGLCFGNVVSKDKFQLAGLRHGFRRNHLAVPWNRTALKVLDGLCKGTPVEIS